MSLRRHRIGQDLVPVAHDHRLAAPGAEGRTPLAVVHVAGVDVMQAFRQGDLARPGQRRSRRGHDIHHLVIGMERREMKRHVGSQLAHDPLRLGLDFGVGIVLAGNDQVGDLEPDVGLVLELDERVEHRLQVRTAKLE